MIPDEQNISQIPPEPPDPNFVPDLQTRRYISKYFIRLPYLITFIVIAMAGFVYGGIWLWQKQNAQTPTPTPTRNQPANLQTYQSEEYGFEFQYHPVSWGNIKTDVEPCNTETIEPSGQVKYDYFEEYQGQPCKKVVFLNGNSELFMGIKSKNYFSGIGRGAYFGDFFLNSCDNQNELTRIGATQCQEKTNPNGIKYLETIELAPFTTDQYYKYYYIQNPQGVFNIVLSEERLKNKNEINEILSTLEFTY